MVTATTGCAPKWSPACSWAIARNNCSSSVRCAFAATAISPPAAAHRLSSFHPTICGFLRAALRLDRRSADSQHEVSRQENFHRGPLWPLLFRAHGDLSALMSEFVGTVLYIENRSSTLGEQDAGHRHALRCEAAAI